MNHNLALVKHFQIRKLIVAIMIVALGMTNCRRKIYWESKWVHGCFSTDNQLIPSKNEGLFENCSTRAQWIWKDGMISFSPMDQFHSYNFAWENHEYAKSKKTKLNQERDVRPARYFQNRDSAMVKNHLT